jgi:2-polyprenyl-3-methyl-5-hydroxy-6-metoxy-1,4-benzoquinol methylase
MGTAGYPGKEIAYHNHLRSTLPCYSGGSRVLELGCGQVTSCSSEACIATGIDFQEKIMLAKARYPNSFVQADIEELQLPVTVDNQTDTYDYIILSDILHVLWDVQQALHCLQPYCHSGTRIVISNYNFVWEPLLKLGELLGLKQRSPNPNWLSHHDIFNLLEIEDFRLSPM